MWAWRWTAARPQACAACASHDCVPLCLVLKPRSLPPTRCRLVSPRPRAPHREQQQEAEATGQEPAGEEGGKAAAAAAPQPSDPQWVLEKLLTARVRAWGAGSAAQTQAPSCRRHLPALGGGTPRSVARRAPCALSPCTTAGRAGRDRGSGDLCGAAAVPGCRGPAPAPAAAGGAAADARAAPGLRARRAARRRWAAGARPGGAAGVACRGRELLLCALLPGCGMPRIYRVPPRAHVCLCPLTHATTHSNPAQAQARVDDRFLSDLAQLRRRWKLRRHGGAGARARRAARGAGAETEPGSRCLVWLAPRAAAVE